MNKKTASLIAAAFFLVSVPVFAEPAESAPVEQQPAKAAAPKTKHKSKKKVAAKKVEPATVPAAAAVSAAPAPAPKTMSKSLEAWLVKLRKRVASSQAKQNKLVAVAAVRGSEVSDPAPLYWKGKESEKVVDKAELDEFNAALKTIDAGDHDGGKTQLMAFASAHPQSPLIDDVNRTIEMMNQ